MILMNDFNAEPVALSESTLSSVKRVLKSGWYVLGTEVATFEKEWAATCRLPFAVGVANGMDALEIALRSLDIGEGDEVITTSMTAFATFLAIVRAGATPVLADIDSDTALLSIDSVAQCLSAKTKAIVLVHLYGQVKDMDLWQNFCATHHIELIEDCAQAHLAEWKGTVAGAFGAAGAYSFYPTKNLGAVGDAGMLVTKDEKIAEKAGYIRNYGQTVRYHHPTLGMNSRLDEIQAAILSVRLQWLTEFTRRRREIAAAYHLRINNPLIQTLAQPADSQSHVYHLFVILCPRRDLLSEHLRNKQIQTLIHYPIPVHRQLPCVGTKTSPLGLAVSDGHAAMCLSLPCHPQMTEDQVDSVIDALNSFEG